MSGPSPTGPRALRRGPAERIAAGFHTGPLGHLWSVLADAAVLWTRYGAARIRATLSQR